MNSAEIISKINTLGKEGKLPFSLENCSLKSLRENGQNVPLKAGNKVLRVPKNGKESKTWADLERESQVTAMIQKQNLKTKTSDVKIFDTPEICFAYHEIVEGDVLDNKSGENLLAGLSEKQKDFLAEDLAVFFAELHSIPISETKGIMPYDGTPISYDYEKNPKFDYSSNKKIMNRFGLDLDDFRTPISQDKVFCHNDMHGGNLAVDTSREHILNGVFDFGNADINDRSADFVKLCAMDRNLARRTVNAYNKISQKPVSMKEVDYQYLNWMAQSIKGFDNMNLTPEQKNIVDHKMKRDLGLFRSDVLKEKIEAKAPRKDKEIKPQKLSQQQISFLVSSRNVDSL